MNARLRVAIVGLGAAARQIHIPACQGLHTRLQLVGGSDMDARAGRFPFPLFASAEELVERTRPELLIVATPPDTHFELARLGLAAGCHVLCEKPFAESVEQARLLVALAREVGRSIVVNNQYRFMRMHAAAQALLGTPEFGELLFLDVQQSVLAPPAGLLGWRGQGRERTCREFGTHVLDLCRFFFGCEPLAIAAHMPRPAGNAEPDDLDLIRLDFPGERTAQITLDRLCRGPHRYLALRLDGSRGFVETRLGGGLEFHLGLRGRPRRPYFELDLSLGGRARLYHGERFRKLAGDPLDVFAAATRCLLLDFLSALERGRRPACDAEDNLHTLALMRAAYESAESGRTLRLESPAAAPTEAASAS